MRGAIENKWVDPEPEEFKQRKYEKKGGGQDEKKN